MGSKRRVLSFLLAAMLLLANTAVVAFPEAGPEQPTPVSLARQTLVFAVDSAAYTGTAQTPSFTVRLNSSDGTLLQLATDYTAAYSNNINAGDGTLVITGTGTVYTDSASTTFPIAKAPLTVNGVNVTPKDYDGDSAATVSDVTFGNLQNGETLTLGEDYSVTATFADANAGSGKAVTGAVTLRNTPKANNYRIPTSAFTSTGNINKVDYDGTLSGATQVSVAAGANTYALSNLALPAGFANVTYAYQSMTAGNLLNSGVTPTISNDGVLSFTTLAAASGASGSITVTVRSDNYNDVNAVITVTASGKLPCTVSNVTLAGITYGGTLGTPTASVSGASGTGSWTYTYSGAANDGATLTNSAEKPTKAGSYTVTATYETETHRGSGSAAFTIAKKQLGWNTAALRVTAKPFDNSTAASFTGTPALSGAKTGDTPVLGSYRLAGAFSSVNVASGKTVTAQLSGAALDAATAYNYLPPADYSFTLRGDITELSQPFCATGTLTAQTLTGARIPNAGVYAGLSDAAAMEKAQSHFLTAIRRTSGFSGVSTSRIRYTDLTYSGTTPSAGITFWLPYPTATIADNWDDYKFTLKHMKSDGIISGVSVTPTVNGLKVTGVTSMSPFALGWVKRSTRSSSSYSSSGGGSQSDFWDAVYKEINRADAGTTVKVAAKSYTTMPSSVMRALDEADRVALSITWNGGDDILIPANKAQKDYASRSYYTLSYLVGKYIGNPDTGGREDPPVAVTVLAPDENAVTMALAQERVPLTQTAAFRWTALIIAAGAGALVLLGGTLACRIDWKKKR